MVNRFSNHPRETPAKRRIPLIDENARSGIFGRMEVIRETIMNQGQKDTFLFSAARYIASADMNGLLSAFDAHPVAGREINKSGGWTRPENLLLAKLESFRVKVLQGLMNDRQFTPDEMREYRERKARFIGELMSEFPGLSTRIPVTFKLTLAALNTLPEAVLGDANDSSFSSKLAWVGGEISAPQRPGKIVIALSGGAAKGMFYLGFIRALRENGIWPDIVIGTSAGALAAAGLASGKVQKVLEDEFSAKNLKRVFSPYLAPFTLLASGGSGIIGYGYGNYLKKVFGEAKFSDIADCFVVSAVQRPTLFGRTIIGRSSEDNGSIALSSDIPLYQGVWGSSAIQGIVPHPIVRGFTAERLEREQFGSNVHGMVLPYASLDDGGVSEDLPLESAELILERTGSPGLIIMVNLSNLSPAKAVVPPEVGGGILAKAGAALNNILENSAPMRAYNGFTLTFNSTIVNAVKNSSGRGMKILLNPNNDGSLDGIGLLNFNGADAIVEYGYNMGTNLCWILLAKTS